MNLLDLVIGGDICPVSINEAPFSRRSAVALFDGLLPVLEGADLRLFNLECPLLRRESPIAKCGPALGVPVECISGIQSIGADLINLANNHILDHDQQGLATTLEVFREAGIEVFGAGENLAAARKIIVRQARGIRVGFLGLAEHEFSIAGPLSGGANPLDLVDYVRNVKDRREDFDYLVVLLHGGNENIPYPNPRLRDICRFLIEEGASAVVCQHSHCPGACEKYLGGHIVYGQGNLIFQSWTEDYSPGPDWYEGYLVRLRIETDGSSGMELVPFRQEPGQPGVTAMQGSEKEAFLSKIRDYSRHLLLPGFLEGYWRDFCAAKQEGYLRMLFGGQLTLEEIIRRSREGEERFQPAALLALENITRCEAHREVLESIFTALRGVNRQ